MEKRFLRSEEVAALLRVQKKTFQNYVSRHSVYKPGHAGVWPREQVRIIEQVWSGVLSEDEGMAFWHLAKDRLRASLERDLGISQMVKAPRKGRN